MGKYVTVKGQAMMLIRIIGLLAVLLVAAAQIGCNAKEDSTGHEPRDLRPALAAKIEIDLDRTALGARGLTADDVTGALDRFFSEHKTFSFDDINGITVSTTREIGISASLSEVASVRIHLSVERGELRSFPAGGAGGEIKVESSASEGDAGRQ